MTTEAEPGVMGPQAKECLRLPEAEKMPLSRVFRVWPCRHLDFKFLACRTVKEYISPVLSH